MAGNLRLALLIDADNVSAKYAAQLLFLVSNLGSLGVRRAYGDWGAQSISGWRECVREYSLHPVQQIAYVSGKNATDIAMVIDAMDLLHAGGLDGFCLVSSDSDFTPLAIRIREKGLKVFGFGTRVTPRSFVASCDQFEFLDTLEVALKSTATSSSPVPKPSQPTVAKPVAKGPEGAAVVTKKVVLPQAAKKSPDKATRKLLRSAVTAVADKTGWASFPAIGSKLKEITGGDVKSLGYGPLQALVAATGDYEFEGSSSSPQKCILVRPKTKLACIPDAG